MQAAAVRALHRRCHRCRARCSAARAQNGHRTDRSVQAPCAQVAASTGRSPGARASVATSSRCPIPAAVRMPSSRQDRCQHIKVIAVLMATGNREHPRPRHVAVAVPDTPAIAIVRNVPAEHRGETEPLSISRRINTPPFDDSVPPSNVAVIVFPLTGDRPGRNSVVSVMVSGAFLLVAYDHVSTTESFVSRPVSSPLTSPNSCRHE